MLTTSASDTLAQATAIAAIVTMLIGILRPFIEQLPFARPAASTHDATLRLLNLLLNVGGVLAVASVNGNLAGSAWLALAIQALAQASGSHILFHSVTSSAGSAASSAPAAPAATPAPAPAAPAPAPSLATIAAPTAASVASAITSAIQQQGQAASATP